MRLPGMKYKSGKKKVQQVKFGGLDHRPGCKDGYLWDMNGISGDHFPLLATRYQYHPVEISNSKVEEMFYVRKTAKDGGSEKLYCYVRDGYLYVGVKQVCKLRSLKSGEVRCFAQLQDLLVVFPDKIFYNVELETAGPLEDSAEAKCTFRNGTYKDAPALANTIYCEGAPWGDYNFHVGDAVTISGSRYNNGTYVIQEIEGFELRFPENCFHLAGDSGTEEYEEYIRITREVPDLVCVFTHNNRLWGADKNTIYVSRLGDAFVWNNKDGDKNCWQWEPGSGGSFTAGIVCRGYPTFFKEDMIYKIYGSVPSNFSVTETPGKGVATRGKKSLAIAGNTLFYLSNQGIMAYEGGLPTYIGEPMGTNYILDCVAGSTEDKYYASIKSGGSWRVYSYDTKLGLWYIEDSGEIYCFYYNNDRLWFSKSGGIWEQGREGYVFSLDGDPLTWYAEFGDFTEDEGNKKGVSQIQIRTTLENGATMQVLIQYDSDGRWQHVGKGIRAAGKQSFVLPLFPRRCDHYRLKLEGVGGMMIHSITREFYVGSER